MTYKCTYCRTAFNNRRTCPRCDRQGREVTRDEEVAGFSLIVGDDDTPGVFGSLIDAVVDVVTSIDLPDIDLDL